MSDTEPKSHDKVLLYVDQQFEDEDVDSDFDPFADPNVLAQSSLIQTQAWWRAEGDEAGEIPQSLLYELPLAMRTAQVRLAGLAVNIKSPSKLNWPCHKISSLGSMRSPRDWWLSHFG